MHAPHLLLGPDGHPNVEHSGSLVWMLAVRCSKTNVAATQKCQHYLSSAAVPQYSVSAACTDWRSEALRAVGPQAARVAQTLQVRGRRTGRRSNVAVEGEAGLNTAQLASRQAPQRLKGTCKQRLPANQRAEASCQQQCKRLRIQGKMRASPRLCTLAQPVTCQLTSKTALCKALADVPSLAAAKSAAHLMSCGAHDDSRDIKFSSMGPKDKSRRVAGNVPDGNPLDVLPFNSSNRLYHCWRGKGYDPHASLQLEHIHA